MVEAGFAAAYFATECRTPDSRTHVSAKASARPVQASAILLSQTARSACVMRGHGPSSKALRAAATARSTSSTWASATDRKTSSFALSRTSMRERDDGSTHSPPMKKRSGLRICCWTASMGIVPPVLSVFDDGDGIGSSEAPEARRVVAHDLLTFVVGDAHELLDGLSRVGPVVAVVGKIGGPSHVVEAPCHVA